MSYETEARTIWKTYVPPSGQAKTVQGELLRAVEKLRDEAQRNGNVNWDDGHKILARFVRTTLIDSGLFDAKQSKDIHAPPPGPCGPLVALTSHAIRIESPARKP